MTAAPRRLTPMNTEMIFIMTVHSKVDFDLNASLNVSLNKTASIIYQIENQILYR